MGKFGTRSYGLDREGIASADLACRLPYSLPFTEVLGPSLMWEVVYSPQRPKGRYGSALGIVIVHIALVNITAALGERCIRSIGKPHVGHIVRLQNRK